MTFTKPNDPNSRVLILEDTAGTVAMLQAYMKLTGWQCDIVEWGKDAINQYQLAVGVGKPYCCIVLDIAVSDITGLEVARYIRSTRGDLDTPIVFWTAYDQEMNRQAVADTPNAVYLTKVMTPDKLFEVVQELCDRVKKRDGV